MTDKNLKKSTAKVDKNYDGLDLGDDEGKSSDFCHQNGNRRLHHVHFRMKDENE
jgi:hypothetical protein